MPISLPLSPRNALISFLSLLVFTSLDLLDFILCYFYRFLDGFLEDSPIPCYCNHRERQGRNSAHHKKDREEDREDEISETLYKRRNIFRVTGNFIRMGARDVNLQRKEKKHDLRFPRWSDCCCRSCVSWQENGQDKLHLVVKEPSQGFSTSFQNVIFVHGFASSSFLWTETVFPNLSDLARQNFRMFAVDLLGFGKSPKPSDCLYTLKDHVGMIEKSVVEPFQLKSYHLVAHSMGCTIALAFAAMHPYSVKSITLIAPPYFDSTEGDASFTALRILAKKTIWPPLLFGSAVMTWYEHIGRTVCSILCRHHLVWEAIFALITRRRPSFEVTDVTMHTHHSAWHSMHNVICGGAKLQDKYLEAVDRAKIPVRIFQGDKDSVVPIECSYNLKSKLPLAQLKIVIDADHNSVISGREKEFTNGLEEILFE